MYESDDKMVSHPIHYQSKSGLEVIDVIKAFTEDLTGYKATDTGNIIKYACRWNQKGGKQDLKKIIWYAQHLLDLIEEEELDTEFKIDPNVADKLNEKATKYLNDMEPVTFTFTSMLNEDEIQTIVSGDYSDTKKFVKFDVEDESDKEEQEESIKDVLDDLYAQCEILMCKVNQMRRINAGLEK